jgi:ubiquinone/menaquinone biosynthesis C-methylase UbiE
MAEPEEIRRPRFARFYARASVDAEERGMAEHRRRLLAGLGGRVIEVGCGNGLNFGHYPREVTEVLAVEPEPYLRGLAEQAARRAAVTVRVVPGTADRLPAPDRSADAVVCSLVLCSVPDQGRALAEVVRVLRPGGELRFYEHVVSPHRVRALGQRLLDATVWPRLAGGCHLARDTGAAIAAAGLVVDRVERIDFKASATSPRTHLLGRAHRA